MSWGGPGFVLALIAMSMIGWVVTTAIRAKHGYPLNDDWGGPAARRDEVEPSRQARLMAEENERLAAKVGRLEERIAVLERIATDPATRTARKIDALR